MNRPFLFIGIGALLASFAIYKSGWLAVGILLLAAGFTIITNITKQNSVNKGVIIALIFIVLTVRMLCVCSFNENINRKLVGTTADITAQITEIVYESEKFSVLTLKVKESSEESAKGIKIKASFYYNTEASSGDIINARIKFSENTEDFKTYNYGNGIYFSGEIEKIYSFEKSNFSLYKVIYNVRTAVLKSIDTALSDESGAVLKALVIGDDTYISKELDQNVRVAGVSHMLVVSGMHLSILCTVALNLLNGKTKRWISVSIGAFLVLFILAVCLFHVSILRASIAYIVMLLAKLLKRTSDPLSALGFGVFVAVFMLPYIFYNVAFMLSIAATFAVLYPARFLINAVGFERFGLLGKAIKPCYEIIIITVCTLFCTLPIVAYYFGYVALAAPFTNLIVTLAMNLALIIGVLAVMLSFLPLGIYLSAPFFFVSRLCINYFIWAVDLIGKNDFGVVFINKDKNIYCFLITIAFILLVRIFTKPLILKREEKLRAERQNT